MRFVCLVYHDERRLEALGEAELAQLALECRRAIEQMRRAGRQISSTALKSARAATTVSFAHDRLTLADGPFDETPEQLCGFLLIEARDLDEALAVAARLPSARIGKVEVRPVAETECIFAHFVA
jgi:hypothetical protein